VHALLAPLALLRRLFQPNRPRRSPLAVLDIDVFLAPY
jgi:hypothetical protein